MHEHPQAAGFDFQLLFPFLILTILFIVYVAGTITILNKGKRWSKWRSLSFITGLSILGFAFLPSTIQYAHQQFKGHMLQHILIGMLAPIGLVMGAPVTLALKSLPTKSARLVIELLKCRVFHFISHPFTALLLNIGGMFILYLTPIYNASFTNPVLHHLIHIHFLAAGYLFTWSIIGPDPAPRRPGLKTRGIFLFLSMAAHAYLSKFMYAYLYPRNSIHTDEDIRSAAKFMYYGGDFSELIVVILFFLMWYKKRIGRKYSMKSKVNETLLSDFN